MSGRHQPENGADSPEARSYYVVTMGERYGEGRMTRRIYAYGPHDARNLAEDIYHDWLALEANPESNVLA